MRVTIEVYAHNGNSYPERNYNATIRISGVQERRGSNVVTKGLVDASGHAALKIVEAMKR